MIGKASTGQSASASTDGRPSLPPDLLVRLAIVVALSVVASLGFRGALSGWSFLPAGLLGAFGAAAVIVVAVRHRMLVGESIALSLLAFVIVGPIASSGLPVPSAFASFFAGLVNGWSDLLSSAPPADVTPQLRVLPFAVGWLGTLIGGELVRRRTLAVVPVVGPATALVITMLVTVEDRTIALIQGVALGVGAVLLGIAHQWLAQPDRVTAEEDTTRTAGRSRPRSLAWGAGLLAMISVAAPMLGPSLPLAAANERFDLRQFQERPWDPLAGPSPLVTLKASLKEGAKDEVLFVVDADRPITHFTSAVLATYNGTVWAVADEATDAPAEFQPVDTVLPKPPAGIDTNTEVTYQIEIRELDGPWVPIAGWPARIERDREGDLRLNRATGTVANPDLNAGGQRYRMTSYLRPDLTDLELLGSGAVSNDEDAELDLVPPGIRNLAGDLFEGVDAGTARAVALSNNFTLQGFYDQGDSARPGHSLARLDEFLEDQNRLVGYAEQYAAGAAVLARVGGLPSRVVVGYVITEDRYESGRADVIADDIAAWIEVETTDHGWVPLDVTPDRAREPEEEQLGVTIKDVAIPNPPPPPPPPPDLRPPAQPTEEDEEIEEEEETDDEDASPLLGDGWGTAVAVGGGAIVGPIALLSLLGLVVVGWKRRRSRRRRQAADPSLRIAGAWRELVDRYHEAGVRSLDAATPTESIHAYLRDEPASEPAAVDLAGLAESVDRAAFHPQPPSDADAERAWEHCENAVDGLLESRGWRERVWMRTDPRPLLKREEATSR